MQNKEIIDAVKALSTEQHQYLLKYTYCLQEQSIDLELLKNDIKATCQSDCFDAIVEFFARLNQIHRNSNKDVDIFLLMDELQVPKEVQQLYSPRNISLLLKSRIMPVKLKWRIDVRVPKINTILIHITKEDGDVCLRLDIASFHKLRFNVSLILKEIFNLKRKYNKN